MSNTDIKVVKSDGTKEGIELEKSTEWWRKHVKELQVYLSHW